MGGVGDKDTLSSLVKAFVRFRSLNAAQEEVVQRVKISTLKLLDLAR